MDAFFRPTGVAVVGASRHPGKIGHQVLRNLLEAGYPGDVHPVNPRDSEILGRTAYPTLSAVPGRVELVVLAAPASAVAEFLADLDRRMAERGDVRAMVAVSAGFADAGTPKGRDRQERLAASCRRHGIRLLGPNCIGVVDTHARLDTTFIQLASRAPGDLGLISQSGAMVAWLEARWTGDPAAPRLSKMISPGNMADADLVDAVAYLAADPDTRTIGLYVEGTRRARELAAAVARAAREKPVVVLKVGRSERGRSAAASHTGALAGDDQLWDAALGQAGAARAATVEEFSDLLLAFGRLWPLLVGPAQEVRAASDAEAMARPAPDAPLRVALLTNAGGPGVYTADALSDAGLGLARFGPETRLALRATLPPYAAVGHPDGHVDTTAGASPTQLAEAAATVLRDPGVDALVYLVVPAPFLSPEEVADSLLQALRSRTLGGGGNPAGPLLTGGVAKPIIPVLPGGPLQREGRRRLAEAGLAVFEAPDRAARAIGAIARYRSWLRRPWPAPWLGMGGQRKPNARPAALSAGEVGAPLDTQALGEVRT